MPQVVSGLAPIGRLAGTNQLRLAIGVLLRDRAGLENFVAQVSDPASPNFRHYLTREQLTARFGPTEQDYKAVKDFARTNNFTITGTSDNRLLLDVLAPAAAVEKAFHITLRTYRHPTEARNFYAPDSEPQVDAALPVEDILGLSDFSRPHPKSRRISKGAQITPRNGTAPDGSGNLFGNDFRNAYVPGTTLTGAGQSVGLVEFDGFYANDISNYARLAGNGRTNIVIQTVLLDGFNGVPVSKGPAGGEAEVALDIEMAMAIAPGLDNIVSYTAGESGNQNDILNAMLANSNVVNLSCSWGWGGPSNSTDAIIMSMDAVGQTFFDGSGDFLAYTTGSNSVNGIDNPSVDEAPASNPYITQVGGTTLTMNGNGVSWASEVVWNWLAKYQVNEGSGGGISSYYSIPSWQTNISNLAAAGGSTNFRNVPDVAANADNIYEIYDNGNTADPYGDFSGDFDGIGGTSAAAPLWAGFMALVSEQSVAHGGTSAAGFINPVLYAIAAGSNYSSYFHDVTSGNNVWYPSSPHLFYAMTNYDLCTGLGSMNGTNMINALAFPMIQPSSLVQPADFNAVFTVPGAGALPSTYQWQFNGTNLTDNEHISGSQTSTLTISNDVSSDAGDYQVIVATGLGTNLTEAATLTVTPIAFDNGAKWSANGDANFSNGVLSLTQGSGSEASSSFLEEPLHVAAFLASWTYQETPGGGAADGVAFVLQNAPAGPAAIGGNGDELGYVGIPNSTAFEFNIYSPSTVGVGIGTNGLGSTGTTNESAGPYFPTGLVNIASGYPIDVTLQYVGGVATLTLWEPVASVLFTTNYLLNVTNFVGGSTAYVGFTGSDGGVVSSQTVSNFLFTSLPVIQPASLWQPVGLNAVFNASVGAAQPSSYQWQFNGTNLVDNGHIVGSQTDTLTIANDQLGDSGNYQLTVVTAQGSKYTATAALTVTLVGFNNGDGWLANGDASIRSGALSLTQGSAYEASSFFLEEPLDVAAFLASWTYQESPGDGAADGMAFVLQNSPAGTAAIGGNGNELGYVGIANSIAFEFNIYSPNSVGIAIGTNGLGSTGTTNAGAGPFAIAAPVNIASGDPIGVTLKYLGGVASLTLTDSVANVSFTTNYLLNITNFIGGSAAYVGFTGADGGITSSQSVRDFSFTSLPSLKAASVADGALVFTWPVSAPGFALQQSFSLSSPDWVSVTNVPVVVNGQNQITVPLSGTCRFYRLVIQ